MVDAIRKGVKNELKIADWAKKEQKQKRRAERRERVEGHVRSIFVLLLFGAIFVFIFNHQVEIQRVTFAKLNQVMKKSTTADKLRENAMNYEKTIDKINQ